jgi:outer membrane receptor protein involved in Fe transport
VHTIPFSGRFAGARVRLTVGILAALAMGSPFALQAQTAAAAAEQPATVAFDIPAQELGAALRSFGQASGQQLVFDEAATRGKRSAALSGSFTVEDGLQRLLQGTGLSARATDSGVLTIQAPAPETPAAPVPAGEAQLLDAVVVTGTTASNRTVLESSVAVTVANREALDRKAPRSTAQALELIPGIFVEASGGEVSNNFSVRGLAGGGQQFVQLSEDGLPVFYTNALSDTILKQEVAIDRLEAVRGGTSGVLTVNGAGATINFITRRPKADPEGVVRLTVSDFNTRRVDLWQGGALNENWNYSIGGFLRAADSVRDTGFTAESGGILRLGALRFFDQGEFGLNLKVVNDHNTFLLPIPLQDPDDPRGIPGMDPNYGTMISRDNSVQNVRVSPASGRSLQRNDLRDGVETISTSLGYTFEWDFSETLLFRSKGRYTDFENSFNSVFSFDNDSLVPATFRLDPAQNDDVQLLLNRFAPQGAVRAGLQRVSNGEIIADTADLNALNGNGLTAESITANNTRFVEEFVNDASLTWQTERNSLTVGLLYFNTKVSGSNIGASTFVSEVRDNPERLDIVALDAANNVVGYLTEDGLLNYGSFGEGISRSESDSLSLYINDEFEVTERLRIDAGVRVERFELTEYEGISQSALPVVGAFDASGNDVDNIIANNFIAQFGGGAFTGAYRRFDNEFTETAATLGGNFRVFDNFTVYARYARGFQGNGRNDPTIIDFGEFGARFQNEQLSASLTAFRTSFKDFRFSRQPAGAILPVEFNADINVLGVEFDLLWKPSDWFQLQAVGVVQDSELAISDDQGTGFASQFDGNKPERTPPINVTLTPSFLFPNDRGEFYVSYHYLDKIYSDVSNSLELPAYGVWSAGVIYNASERLQAQLSVDNLTNEIGLTEGNPRAGFTENPGVSDFFYARPILGRNAVLSLTYRF